MVFEIRGSLDRLTHALHSGARVDGNRKGQWYREGWLMRLIRWLFGWEDEGLIKVSALFSRALDQLEREPVKFLVPAGEVVEQRKKFEQYLTAGDALIQRLKKSKAKKAAAKIRAIEYRLLALKYRIEKNNGGLDKDKASLDHTSLEEEVVEWAKEWKRSNPLYLHKELHPEELKRLRLARGYKEMVALMRHDKDLREQFFKWVLRDNCPIDAFFQFPATSARLKNALLAGRIGRYRKYIDLVKYKGLTASGDEKQVNGSFCLRQGYCKDYVLPFEVQSSQGTCVEEMSILDESAAVAMRNNYKVTIGHVLDSFTERNKKPGNFEMLGPAFTESGLVPLRIANHNSLEMGPYNPQTDGYDRPNFTEEKKYWWHQIPTIDIMDEKDIENVYSLKNIPQGHWFAAVCSSREDPGLDVEKNHGYLVVGIPHGNGNFAIYSLGKYAAYWPKSFLEKMLFVTNTVKAKFECPDENSFMGQRQHAMDPRILTPEEGFKLMDDIRKDLKEAQRGNAIMQFFGKNCAFWAQMKMERIHGPQRFGGSVPEYFRMPLLQAESQAPLLSALFRFCRRLAGKVQEIAVRIFAFFLMAWRGETIVVRGQKVVESVLSSDHMKKLEISHPACFHNRIINKEVKGVISFTHLFLTQAASV